MGTTPSPAERIAQLRLARTRGIGTATFTKLMGLYGTAAQAIEALPDRARLAGRTPPPVPSPGRIEDEIAWLAGRGACHVLRSDAAYPRLLTTLPDAPVLLFAQGDTALLSAPSLAIVGARKASSPALDLTEQFATGLAEAGLTIVSGLARGIDGAAHRGALPSGRTIAALPGGLDVTYPPEHARLQEEIAQQGCLLTEYPPGTIASARHFPRRNHLIAGIARGCLLVEAARRSGTLITARLALTYQRHLFAVPGFPKDPRSGGGNDLLRQNKALLVERFEDILDALENTPQPDPVPAPWSRPPARQPSLFSHPVEHTPLRGHEPWQDEPLQHDIMPAKAAERPSTQAELPALCQHRTHRQPAGLQAQNHPSPSMTARKDEQTRPSHDPVPAMAKKPVIRRARLAESRHGTDGQPAMPEQHALHPEETPLPPTAQATGGNAMGVTGPDHPAAQERNTSHAGVRSCTRSAFAAMQDGTASPATSAGRDGPAIPASGHPVPAAGLSRASFTATLQDAGETSTVIPGRAAAGPGMKETGGDEKNILSLLAHTPSTVDEIASRCQLSISAVAAILIGLEMDGAIQRHEDGRITTL